jgi:hypothetical protein
MKVLFVELVPDSFWLSRKIRPSLEHFSSFLQVPKSLLQARTLPT